MVEPGQYARITEIEDTLEAKQAAVGGGLITCAYPWEEPVCIVANDEGLINGMPLNRYVEDYQVIAGPFFICSLTEDDFGSLTDEQAERYREMFLRPEIFLDLEDGFIRIPYDDPHLPNAPEEAVQRFAQHNGLPDLCFYALPDAGTLTTIRYGEQVCRAIGGPFSFIHPEETADGLNAKMGITKEQQTVMLYGAINGWDFSALEQTNPEPGTEMNLTP